jgi:hypothetical protein
MFVTATCTLQQHLSTNVVVKRHAGATSNKQHNTTNNTIQLTSTQKQQANK